MVRLVAALLTLVVALTPAHAVEPGEMLKDPALEARARHISQELRCLVCQNQSIDDSNAELARDLRLLVRERLAAGDSDAAVLRLRRGPLRRVRAAAPALQAAHAPAVADAALAARRHCLRPHPPRPRAPAGGRALALTPRRSRQPSSSASTIS